MLHSQTISVVAVVSAELIFYPTGSPSRLQGIIPFCVERFPHRRVADLFIFYLFINMKKQRFTA